MDYNYSALVIGAGPAGILCVAELLGANFKNIVWVDPTF